MLLWKPVVKVHRAKQLTHLYHSRYLVGKILSPVNYLLCSIRGKTETEIVHVPRTKIYHDRAEFCSDSDSAGADGGDFPTESETSFDSDDDYVPIEAALPRKSDAKVFEKRTSTRSNKLLSPQEIAVDPSKPFSPFHVLRRFKNPKRDLKIFVLNTKLRKSYYPFSEFVGFLDNLF